MDLMFWRDINVLGEKASMIEQICQLHHFNLIFDGISLFHYFSDNSDMIDIIQKKYFYEKQNGTMSETDETLPL